MEEHRQIKVIQGLIPENSLIDIINEIDNAEFDQGDFNDWVPDNNDNYSPEPWSPSDNNQEDPWNTNDNYTKLTLIYFRITYLF